MLIGVALAVRPRDRPGYRDAGARHLVLSLAPAPFAHADPAFMERAAAVLRISSGSGCAAG
jgi:hypothetical protein